MERTPFVKKCLVAILLGISAISYLRPAIAAADEVYTFVVKKQEEKAKSRWSLSEWLETRDRMRLMDLWLALHTPSPYEFFVAGAYQIGNLSTGGSYNASDFSVAAYASIFGLEFEREGGLDTRYSGLFHLRIFGFHYQATHIRLEAGVRNENNGAGVGFQNALAGAGLVIYLGKYFGIEGLFRHAFDSTPNATGLAFGGNRYEGGAFIDFSFLRLYGKYGYESTNPELSNFAANSVRSGPQVGLKLFF
jgi:hypothetical protein